MRMQMIKVVMVLLVVGSSDTRPHKSDNLLKQAKTTENTHNDGWRSIRTLDVSPDIRDDSRYTGTSGSNRKSYITYFRDNVDSSREHSANIYSLNKIARIFNARHSKLDDIWTTVPDFQATDISSELSKTRVFSRIGAARNSSNNRLFLQNSSSELKTIHDDKMAWIRSILASNKSLGLESGRINYSGKDIENFEKLEFNVRSNQNFKSIVDQIPASVRRNFVASNLPLSIDFDETTYYSPNTTKTSQKQQQKLGSIKYNLSNKDNTLSNIPYSRINSSDISLLEKANIPRRKDRRDAIYENTNRVDSVGTSYKNFQSDVIIHPFFYGTRYILNNSGKSAHDIRTRPSLIQIPKSGMMSRGKTVMSNRNFVKLRHLLSNSPSRRNVSNIANLKLMINNNVSSVVDHLKNLTKSHFAQAVVKKSDATNNHALSELTKNHHFSFAQKLSSQANERVGNKNKTRNKYSASPAGENAYLKNWPNDIPENIEDFYNYEKYISSLKEEPDQVAEQPILLSNDSYFSYPDSILDSSVKKIIHWLQIPDIAPNSTHFANDNRYYTNAYKPIESKLESIYGNFEPNRPNVSTEENSYKIVIQKPLQNQKFDKIGYEDHPGRWPLPTSAAHPQYVTSSSHPFTLVSSSSFDATLLRNKTVYNPTTYVTQNTIVHILNNDLKKPNVTVTQLTPELESIVNQTVSSEYLTESSSDLAQRPNLHTMFISQKNEDHQPSKQKTNTFPSSSYNTNCPTIMINTYTRVNNTIQSKEGCTDLDIIVNSHVLNTNVIKPSDGPTEVVQQTSLVTQSYANENKYSGQVDNLSHQDSVNSYVSASTGSYGSGPLETPGPNNYEYSYYDSQKNPVWTSEQNNSLSQLSAVEVFQDTQISISGSNVSLSDVEANVTAESNLSVTEYPAGSFADHSSAPVDEALSSAAVPPASGISVAGSPSSINFPASVNMPLVALNSPGIVTGQANNGPTPGFLQLPVLPSFSVRPSAGSLLPSSASSDDDDDDNFDMSPADVLQSIASVFTYFTFMNPLDYSFFSLAAAPFAAIAAGVLGIVAVAFPWALPNVFDFGRAADKVTIRFKPSFEEFVRQAVHKYARLNEWKSRRRKHRK